MSCPKCGGRDITLLPSNEFMCKRCGHRWPIPQSDYSWIEIEIKKAKLFEKYIDTPIENCNELISLLQEELDEKNAKILAEKILLHRAERRRLMPTELAKLYTEAEKCRQ